MQGDLRGGEGLWRLQKKSVTRALHYIKLQEHYSITGHYKSITRALLGITAIQTLKVGELGWVGWIVMVVW